MNTMRELKEELKMTSSGRKFLEEIEPYEDAISRADAIRVASGYCHPSNIAKELARLQSVQPKMAEPCEDAVSREDVIKAVDHHTFDTDDGLCLDEDITIICEELPPVKPTQRWIPVSEKVPEENGFYLATCDGEICGENEPFTGLAEYENGKWVDDEEDYQCVLAWMPLPEPYTEKA